MKDSLKNPLIGLIKAVGVVYITLGVIDFISAGWANNHPEDYYVREKVWYFSEEDGYGGKALRTITIPAGETVGFRDFVSPQRHVDHVWLYEAEKGPGSVEITTYFHPQPQSLLSRTRVKFEDIKDPIALSDVAKNLGDLRFAIRNLTYQAQRFRIVHYYVKDQEYTGPRGVAYVEGLCSRLRDRFWNAEQKKWFWKEIPPKCPSEPLVPAASLPTRADADAVVLERIESGFANVGLGLLLWFSTSVDWLAALFALWPVKTKYQIQREQEETYAELRRESAELEKEYERRQTAQNREEAERQAAADELKKKTEEFKRKWGDGEADA